MIYSKFQKGSSSNCKTLIISFSGLGGAYQNPPTFEFSSYLSKIAFDLDRKFYVDPTKSWYQYGVPGISSNIEEFVEYLKKVISPYEKTIFMGASAGGYASILFGSLLEVTTVIAFVPQTLLIDEVCMGCYDSQYNEHHRYKDLKNIINEKTNYVLICAENIKEITHIHGNEHCTRLNGYPNVNIQEIYWKDGILSKYRDDGLLRKIITPHLL